MASVYRRARGYDGGEEAGGRTDVADLQRGLASSSSRPLEA